ncbi:MAG: hypothetical protein ACRDRP_07400 [Pseudonocardiaceae bacterium]
MTVVHPQCLVRDEQLPASRGERRAPGIRERVTDERNQVLLRSGHSWSPC